VWGDYWLTPRVLASARVSEILTSLFFCAFRAFLRLFLSFAIFAFFRGYPCFVLLLAVPRTAIPAFETTTTGTRRFASTLSGHSTEDFDRDYEERKVTTRAEPISANRQGQEETVVFSTSKDC
jgi:hypothetical protein